MVVQDMRISVSLATVEFTPLGDNGTHVVFTEQGAFLDGHESPARRAEGMGSLLDALENEVQGDTPGA
jgi:Activator of Hsp90 ATPase homolog 1-like protein